MRVVVADDVMLTREGITRLLADAGVVTASDSYRMRQARARGGTTLNKS
jgi:DNA-binding NarL/FixJ family response regulator